MTVISADVGLFIVRKMSGYRYVCRDIKIPGLTVAVWSIAVRNVVEPCLD